MARLYIESLFPFRLEVVTVLLLAVSAVKVLTSHKNIALSSPAEATFQIEKTHIIMEVLENYPALPGLEKLMSKKGNCLPTLKLQKSSISS